MPGRDPLPIRVPNSAMTAQPVTPVGDDRRRAFNCGSGPFALEVRDAIRRATWFSAEPSLRAIRFDRGDETVGYAVMIVERWVHPTWKSRPKEAYLYLEWVAVSVHFRGQDPAARPGERFSDVILRHVTEEIAPRYPQIVGVLGIVRSGNVPAISLLARHGFAADEGGPFNDRLTGAPSMIYRMLLPGRA